MSPRKKSLSSCSFGTPMKQLTITESFSNSKSSWQISCKKSQAKAKMRKLGKTKLPPLIPIGDETKKSVNKGTMNDQENQNREPNVVHARTLYYPIGSDSEPEQEQNSNYPTKEPKIVMALNKPTLSTQNVNQLASSPERTPTKSTNCNSDANESVSSFGSNDSQKTLIYNLDDTINSVCQSSEKIQVQSVKIFRTEDLNNTSTEEILVQPDIPEIDVNFDSPGINTNRKAKNGVNKKKLSVAKKLNFNESASQRLKLAKEPLKNNTKKKSGNIRKTKASRKADKLKILRQVKDIFPSYYADGIITEHLAGNTKETNESISTSSSVNTLKSQSKEINKMVRSIYDPEKHSNDLASTSSSANIINNHSEVIDLGTVSNLALPMSTPVSSPVKRKAPTSQKPSVAPSPKRTKKNPSPIKWDQSPIKNLKAKEGKALQKKHMQLFVDLIKQVMVPQKNVHHIQLLPVEERKILQKFLNLEDHHRYFLMKLFLWKQIWYNIFTFCDKANIEIQEKKNIIEIFDDLKMAGLVLTDFKRTDNMGDLLNNLDRAAVKDITKKLTRKEGKNKQENIGILIDYAATQATLSFTKTFKDLVLDEIGKKMGDSVKIKPDVYSALSNVYLLAMFTNEDFDNIQDYFNAIIYNNVEFPNYTVEPYVIFYSRDEFLKYARSRQSLRDLDDFIAKKNKTGILEVGQHAFDQLKIATEEYYLDSSETFTDAPHLKKFTASHVYQRVISSCSDNLFTAEPETVRTWLKYLVETFPTSQRIGKWYHKLISMYMRQLKPVNYQAAADLLIDVLENKKTNLNEIDLMEIGKLAQKLIEMKKQRVNQSSHDLLWRLLPRLINVNLFQEDEFDAEYIETELKGKRNYKVTDAAGTVSITSVENMAIEYYKLDSYPQGSHSEGGLIKALLVLFFWDIIYNPEKHIPGTFLSPQQSYPLDMFTKYFYKNRAYYIQDRLDCIRFKWTKEQLHKFAKETYENNSHRKAVYGLVMHSIEDPDLIDELLSVIDRKLLADIFQRILQNIRAFSSGMPDLMVWNAEEKTCKFVEVKGHGDRLSTKQELWLEYLQKKGANIAVCYVNSKGSKKTKRITSIVRNITNEVPEDSID